MNKALSGFLLTFISPPLPYLIEYNRMLYETGQRHPSRANSGFFDLIYVREGSLSITEDGISWKLQAGDSLIMKPNSHHYANESCSELTVFDWVHFQTTGKWEESNEQQHTDLRGDHYLHAIRIPKQVSLRHKQEADQLFDRLFDAARSSSPDAFWQRQQLFLQLLQSLERDWRLSGSHTALAVAERAAAYLKLNYRMIVTNKSLAEELRLHSNYIARCMVEVFGLTPQQYLLSYRMDQAKLLLIQTDWPVARIAEEMSFRQTPHFSRTFSEQTGLSPLQYRKQYKVSTRNKTSNNNI